jgi:hypothetical protein
MQKLLLFCSIFMLLTAFQCSKNEPQVALTRAELDQKKAILLEWVESVPCQEATGCSYIALGTKPCGGPWEYLLYSNAIDVETLTLMVIEYNELEYQFNLQTGAISDCMMVMPPDATMCTSEGCVGLY